MNVEKETSAEHIISEALKKCKKPIIAFSGGKDSTVVLHLVRRIAPQTIALFNNTGVENKETVKFTRSLPNMDETTYYKKNFWQCVDEYGLPQVKAKAKSHGNRCCYYLKEKPALDYYREHNNDLTFTGLTMAESRNRMMFFKRCGPLYYMKSWQMWKCHPIWDWTEDEVWDYIKSNNIPYNPIYDNGAVRCGCVPCTAYISWKRRLAKENPKMLKLVLKLQGQSQLKEEYEPPCPGGA